MGDDELVAFILKSRERGRMDDQINRALLSVGWKKDRVDAAFAKINEQKLGKSQEEAMAEREAQANEGAAREEKKREAIAEMQVSKLSKAAQSLPSTAAVSPPATIEQKKPEPVIEKSAPTPPQILPPAATPSSRIEPPSKPIIPPRAAYVPPQALQAEQEKPQPPSIATAALKSASQAPTDMEKPYLKQLWPSQNDPTGQVDPFAPPYQTVSDETQVKNPAFANLDRAGNGVRLEKFIPLIALLVVVALLAGAYFLIIAKGVPMLLPSAENAAANSPPTQASAEQPANKSSVPINGSPTTPSPQVPEQPAQLIDCGTDKNCFYYNALGCAAAKAEITDTLTFGATITSTTYTETKGIVDGKCILYRMILKNDISYSDSLKAELAASGQTPVQIAASEAEGKAQAAALEGRYSYCKYGVAEFDAMINGWSKGSFSFSTSDWEKYDCTGTMNDPIKIYSPAPPETPRPQTNVSSPLPPQMPVTTVPSPEPQTNTTFSSVRQYQRSEAYSPSEYCALQGGQFLQAHYKSYYSGDCVSEKNIDGFANQSVVEERCEFIPCCYRGPLGEYSLKYDYFECGFN